MQLLNRRVNVPIRGQDRPVPLFIFLIVPPIVCGCAYLAYVIISFSLSNIGAKLILPSPTPTAIPTATLTQTLAPTVTLPPTTSPTPTATATQLPATATAAAKATSDAFARLNAAYVADVTVPDGTRFDGNTSFTKTWRVKNNGRRAWGTVALGFVSGEQMGAPDTVAVAEIVEVGQQIEISVPMVSPAQNGNYKGVWRLKDVATGQVFGEQLTVVIVVKIATPTPTPKQP